MKKILFFIGLAFTIAGNMAGAQEFLHCSPYKMANHPYLHFENDAEFILKNNVKKVEKVRHEMGGDGQPKDKGEVERIIEFNRDGLPLKLTQTAELFEVQGKIPKFVEYNFKYHGSTKMFKEVSKKEQLKKGEYLETITSFYYDDQSRLLKQDNVVLKVSDGKTVDSDKSSFAIFYNHAGKISTLTEMVIYPSDTVEKYHHYASGFSLDSLFKYRPPIDEKTNYKGRVVEKIVYEDGAIIKGGGHIKEKRVKFTYKYHYNKSDLIDKIQKFNAENRLVEVSYFDYQENLLISESKIDSKEYSNVYVLKYNYLYY